MNLQKDSPLNPFEFAKHLNIPLITPEVLENLSAESKKILLQEDSSAWSALTICNSGKHLVIYNSSNAPQRQSSDIMHELSHIIVGHKEQKVIHSQNLNVVMRDYNADQEDEANWLAGALLLPKEALMKIKFNKISESKALKEYCVSKSLLQMRLNLSGVNFIHKRAKAKYRN